MKNIIFILVFVLASIQSNAMNLIPKESKTYKKITLSAKDIKSVSVGFYEGYRYTIVTLNDDTQITCKDYRGSEVDKYSVFKEIDTKIIFDAVESGVITLRYAHVEPGTMPINGIAQYMK